MDVNKILQHCIIAAYIVATLLSIFGEIQGNMTDFILGLILLMIYLKEGA